MTIDQMEKEIIDYGKSLIFNSNNQDWQFEKDAPCYIKNNIKIEMFPRSFCINVYTDNSLTSLKNYFWLYHTFTFFNSERKILHKRYKELSSYKEYDKMTETYNLLPIKQIRKKKIENINNEQEK